MNTEGVTGSQSYDSAEQAWHETAEYNVYVAISKIYDEAKKELEKTKECISLIKRAEFLTEVGTRLELPLPSIDTETEIDATLQLLKTPIGLDWKIWRKTLKAIENAQKAVQRTRQWKAYKNVQSLYFMALEIVEKTQELKAYDARERALYKKC